MRTLRVYAILASLLALPAPLLADTHPITLGEKASLQAALQRHIDSTMVKGRYLYLNAASGEVRALRPLAAHPVILRMDGNFVLCADFRAEDGSEVNVDYFLAPKGRGYVIFDQQVGNRALVKRLMRDGKVTRVD